MCALAKQSPSIVTLSDKQILRWTSRTGRLGGEIRIIKFTGAGQEGQGRDGTRLTVPLSVRFGKRKHELVSPEFVVPHTFCSNPFRAPQQQTKALQWRHQQLQLPLGP